jgi:hypothetical protein
LRISQSFDIGNGADQKRHIDVGLGMLPSDVAEVPRVKAAVAVSSTALSRAASDSSTALRSTKTNTWIPFWSPRLPASRQGTRWLNVLKTLVTYRLVDPGSEWRLHRQWYAQSAIGDLLGEDFAVAGKDNLYRCLDKLLAHKQELFSFLRQRWQTLFQADFEIAEAVPARSLEVRAGGGHLFRIALAGPDQQGMMLADFSLAVSGTTEAASICHD